MALERALTADPAYPLATIVRRVIDGNVRPVPWPIQTPEQVAESYTKYYRAAASSRYKS